MSEPDKPVSPDLGLPISPRASHENHCFVVMPFGRDAEEVRWFQGWYHTVIEPVIITARYTPVLAATEDQPGAINDEIRGHLVFDPMVIVDLGGRRPDDAPNPNVMYELGIRHAFGLPLVIMAWEGQRLPFDVSNQRAIMTRRDFMDIEPTRQKLARFLQAAKEGKYYNPMESVGREAAIENASLILGEDSMLGALAKEVSELRQAISTRPFRMESQRWSRNRKTKAMFGKQDRATLWAEAQNVGLDHKTWGNFLNSPVLPEMADEMQVWSMEDWKRYLIQRAPDLLEAQRAKDIGKKEAAEEREKDFEELIKQVELILPAQPWPSGVHREVAGKLGIPNSKATKAISELIRRGVVFDQANGNILEPRPTLGTDASDLAESSPSPKLESEGLSSPPPLTSQ